MSETARQRYFPIVADGIAAVAARLSPLKLWRGGKRAYIRQLASWTPTNWSVPVRDLVTLLGGIIVVVTALLIPVGYGIIGYFKEANALTYKAELSAARAAQYIYAPDAPWKYDTDQLAAMSEIRTTTAAPIVQRIVDSHGAIMMQKGDVLPWPTFARRAPIFAAGTMVGSTEVSASLRPLLAEVASVGFGSLVLAVAAYFAFTLLPLGALDRTLAELGTTNDKFRRQNLLLDTALENMLQGLAMFDAEARVVIANDRYAELYGIDPACIMPGTTLREIVQHRMAKGLYAGHDVDDIVREMRERLGAKRVSHISNKLPDGRIIATSVQPRADGGWVVTHEDITEREVLNDRLAHQNELLKQREEELETQNTRFNAAISYMSQGLCLFDADQRVLFANRRFVEIYNLDPEQVRPGTTLRHILEARAARGNYSNIDTAKFVADGVASFGQEVSQIVQLADGRFISVLRRPMPDGGLVSTHEDVTEREKLKARLEQQNEQLDAAMNNMSQGLAMYDAEQRLVICNKDYAAMYGLSPEQVRRGATVREILEARLANGCYVTSEPHRFVDKLVAQFGKIQSEVHELADGRIVNVCYRQTANGGHVITHQDITDQRRSEAKIVHMALHDALTDLPNRVLLNERLEHALARVRRGDLVAVHLLDLDHFKTVNDTLGHPTGDKLLKMVTQRLRTLVRETDTIARMGGDEFAVLQVAISQPADATVLALRIIETVSAPYDLDGTQVVIGTSVGIAIGPADGETPDQLIRNSDLALYRAKADGRGTYRFFGPEMDAQMQVRRTMEYDLRKALAAGEFELHYQPVVNLGTDAISGVEALIRWRHPEKGLIPPNTFIPVAEEIGFIIQIGEWALREACAAARNWPDHIRIAVNLSPIQFRNPGFVQIVVSALAASGLPPERLELEITEGMLLQDNEATLSTLFQLRTLGVRIAMDDFGTGYSSLSYLQSFPFDKIKIDRSFVKDIADGVGSLNIVRAVAAMANGLGMTTTAEGVETKEQLDTVRAEGCTEMQGFLFSKPLPLAELEALLRTSCTGAAGGKVPTDCAA